MRGLEGKPGWSGGGQRAFSGWRDEWGGGAGDWKGDGAACMAGFTAIVCCCVKQGQVCGRRSGRAKLSLLSPLLQLGNMPAQARQSNGSGHARPLSACALATFVGFT